MPDQPLSNSRFLPWLALYALLIAYASTIVGPLGPHLVPLELDDAWARFAGRLAVWMDNGSDQRADWMGNLSMFVPFGFLAAGALWPRRAGMSAMVAAAIMAFLLALGFVLAVKFAQLFFPPRTVTLNYVVAQAGGSIAGIALFGLTQGRLAHLVWRKEGGGRENLRHCLQLYTALLCVFFLMPLDFALSAEDLLIQLNRLPDVLNSIPGAERPPLVRAVVWTAGTIATVPVGMLLVLGPRGRNRFFAAATLRGFVWMAVLLALSTLLLSGSPSLVSLFYRTLGIALGAWSMRWLSRQDIVRLRARLAWLAPGALLPYLGLLLAVNALLSTHWLTPEAALDAVHPRGLLPLYNYYIVSKSEAAKNIVAHVLMYAPLGLFVWVRGYRPGAALAVALFLASGIEAGRYLRPDLQGDLNTIAVAGLSALLAARLMPAIWRMLEAVARPQISVLPDTALGWRERAAHNCDVGLHWCR